ncbi:hypothetical protein ACHQM5_025532 [Ranunculus cassubicifolius]
MFRRLLKPGSLPSLLSKRLDQSTRSFSSQFQAQSAVVQPSNGSSYDHANRRLPWISSFLKFGFFTSLATATGAAAYATYAYTLEDVEYKTKGLRKFTPYVKDDASTIEKLQASLYSAAMTVSAKSIEQYLHLRKSIEDKFWDYAVFLPYMHPHLEGARVYTLVLDLDETLVYSDYNPERGWKTYKRPGVDAFLERLSQIYEVVIYTDQPSEYADPIVHRLNSAHQNVVIQYALSRQSTKYKDGKRYRDLSKLNRDPSRIIYVSGHQESTLQPENSVPVKAWKLEPDDKSLSDLLPFLEYVGVHKPNDIRTTLQTYNDQNIPSEFKRRVHGQSGGIWRR